MIIRILKVIIGVGLLTIACFTFPQAVHERGEALRLCKSVGSQEVYVGSKKLAINKRLLGVMIFCTPVASLASGVFIFIWGIRPKDDTAA